MAFKVSTNVLVHSSDAKQFTGITTTQYDDYIEKLNPIILDDIYNYCKNDFTRSTMYEWDDNISFSTSTGFNTIFTSDTEIDFTEQFATGNRCRVDGSIQNNGFFSISAVGTSYIQVNETMLTESSSTGKSPLVRRYIIPDSLEFIASRMIKYTIDSQGRDGIGSESLGDYSYTLTTIGANSYPDSIALSLNKFRKVRLL